MVGTEGGLCMVLLNFAVTALETESPQNQKSARIEASLNLYILACYM